MKITESEVQIRLMLRRFRRHLRRFDKAAQDYAMMLMNRKEEWDDIRREYREAKREVVDFVRVLHVRGY